MKLRSTVLLVLLAFTSMLSFGQRETMIYSEFSPDGNLILTADFDSLKFRLFDATQQKFIAEIKTGFVKQKPENAPSGRVVLRGFDPSIAHFSPDGKSVYLVYNFSMVRWDIAQRSAGKLEKSVYFLDRSLDGGLLIVGRGKSIAIYDANTLTISKSLKKNVGSRISPDKKFLAASARDSKKQQSVLKLIDIASGKTVWSVPATTAYHSSIAFSPDGKLIVYSRIDIDNDESTQLIFREAATGKLQDSLAGNYVPIFSPDSKKLITVRPEYEGNGFYDSYATVLDAGTRKQVFKLEGHTQSLTAVKFSPDATRIATSSDDGTAIVWDAGTGKSLFTLAAGSGRIELLGFDSKNKYVLTSAEDGRVFIWELESGNLIYTLNGETITR